MALSPRIRTLCALAVALLLAWAPAILAQSTAEAQQTTAPPTTAPPTTAPATTSPSSGPQSSASPPTTAPPGSAPATSAGSTTGGTGSGGGTGTGGGSGASGGPGTTSAPAAPGRSGSPGAGQLGGQSGSRDAVRDLLGGHPGEAARRAVQSAVRELGDLSPAELALFGLLALFALALTAIATTSLWWTLHAWRTPASLAATGFAVRTQEPRHSFSLIVPARHEEAVLERTLERLATSHHPNFEVLAVVGDDDPDTRAVAEATAARHPDRIRVLVDSSQPKSKPKSLNTALPHCGGTVTAVFDAEDEVHPDLLRHVDARFTDTGADVVQGGVQLMNYSSSWYSLRNVLEYYFWFRSRLHFHARQRFIPLGGNTVFIRTDRLREAGGWDPECLAEDCEIGVRLSSRGSCSSSAPAGTRASCRCCARANGAACRPRASACWPATPCPCRSCRRSPGC
jgi:hypothetical protein